MAGAAQELADSIGMIYLIIHNVHCDCLAYMYIIVMVSVDHGWVYCQFIVAFFNHTIAVYFYVKCTILFVIGLAACNAWARTKHFGCPSVIPSVCYPGIPL